MARPLKEGLEYFSHDINMSSDPKIMCLEAKHKLIGYAVYNKLLELIYASSNGELELFEELNFVVLSKKCGVSVKLFKNIVESCVKFKLFDENIYNSKKTLTSNGIRKRFTAVNNERERKRLWRLNHTKSDSKGENSSDLIDVDNLGTSKDIADISVNNSEDATSINTDESKVNKNKSKVNESKAYITNEESIPQLLTLEDLKEALNKASNKIGYLGYIFNLLHKSCPKEYLSSVYGRLGKISKDHNNDYYLILSAIYKTQDGIKLIQGNHLDYIEQTLKSNGHKNLKEVELNGQNYEWAKQPEETKL